MKNKVIVILTVIFFLCLTGWNLFGEKKQYSESERRALAPFPEMNELTDEFETYAQDHFPARDSWRSIKAYAKTMILGQKDNNGLYQAENHLGKIEYPMNPKMADHALEVFLKVKSLYFNENAKIYLAIIPDKNCYLAKENGYLSIDYDAFSKYMEAGMKEAEYIEIADLLEAEDYYRTDSHWRQEKITDVSDRLLGGMLKEDFTDAHEPGDYKVTELQIPFYGVYAGQSALNVKPDIIRYLENDVINGMTVEGASAVYDKKKAEGKDAYEMFLSGNQPVVTIKNPANDSGKRLIVFRDSFGSSIAPLLAEGYSETVLIDLRYVPSDRVGQFVEFEGADVLFLYSTMLLNNSLAIK